MSLVNHETGELVETIGEAEARRLTTEARNEFRSSRDHFDRAWSLIEEAVNGGGHIDLGYRSPSDYLHAEFDGVLSGLDVPSRRTAVRTMTDWGLSTRAIGKPLGASVGTVHNDQVFNAEHLPESPESTQPTPVDSGQTPQGAEEGEAQASSPRAADPRENAAPPRPAVTGIDGKTYARPQPKPQPDPHDHDAAMQRVAEDNSGHLARSIRYLLTLAEPSMRESAVEHWQMGHDAVPPAQRADVRPDQMRAAADALTQLADAWK